MKEWTSAVVLSREAGDLATGIKCQENGYYFTAVNAEEDSIR